MVVFAGGCVHGGGGWGCMSGLLRASSMGEMLAQRLRRLFVTSLSRNDSVSEGADRVVFPVGSRSLARPPTG